jgi:hypothetical protein
MHEITVIYCFSNFWYAWLVTAGTIEAQRPWTKGARPWH